MMNSPHTSVETPAPNAPGSQTFPFALTTLTSLFFIWGFITALNDILIPHLKNVFSLSYTQAMLIQFCFFGAYFLISIPAGSLVSRVGYQRGMVIGLVIAGLGCLLFVPAASMQLYPFFLGALFVLASGITILQVSANPFVAALGPPTTASSRLTMTQGFNALGTTLAPFFGALLILGAAPEIAATDSAAAFRTDAAEAVKLPYILIALTLVVLSIVLARIKLPTIEHDSPTASPATLPTISLWRFRHLILGAVGIFVYVGAEVAIGSLLINFIGELNLGLTEQVAAQYVALYWGGAMVGRFVGAWIMTKVQPGRCLAFNAVCATALIITAVISEGHIAMYAILLVGLCNSIMFPTIFSLALHGLGPQTSRGSGILCVAIVGGALIPVAQGALADFTDLQTSFLLPTLCYLYIAYYGLQGCKVFTSEPSK